MTDTIKVSFYAGPVLARLADISRQVDDLSPAMRGIGEILAESTRHRFSTSTGPDGEAWKPNKVATVLGVIGKIRGAYRKDGRLTKKGATAFAGKKPLVDTGELRDSIRYALIDGGKGVEIGTNRFAGECEGGAAVHQFGNEKGTIPARPFLGLSSEDRGEVLAILDRFLRQAVGA